MKGSPQFRKIALVTSIAVVLLFSVFASLRLDFSNRSRSFENTVRDNPFAMEAFEGLEKLTPEDAIVFSWWDYGRLVEEFGHRKAVVSHPSRDILMSVGESQNPIHALEMQLFGKFESHEKIIDIARALLLPEEESLAIMKKYKASHVMVFKEKEGYGAFDDLYKLPWITRIAGVNLTDYLAIVGSGKERNYLLGQKAETATILRLIYDTQFHPEHFTKIFENEVAKIYSISY